MSHYAGIVHPHILSPIELIPSYLFRVTGIFMEYRGFHRIAGTSLSELIFLVKRLLKLFRNTGILSDR
jgi:hypothetical protein